MATRHATRTAGSKRRTGAREITGLVRSDPFQILSAEHELLRAQIRRALEPASAGLSGDGEAIAALDAAVRRHIGRENRALYPVCERLFGAAGAVSVLRADHMEIEETLDELGNPSVVRVRRFERLLEDHLVREERVLFPMTAALLSGVEMDRLARQLRSGSPPRGAGIP